MECSSCKIDDENKYKRKSEFDHEHEIIKSRKQDTMVETIRSNITTRTEFLVQELIKQKASLMKQLDEILALNDKKRNSWDSDSDNLKEILGLYKKRYPLNYEFASENDIIEILTDIAYDSTSLDLIRYKFIPSRYSSPPGMIGKICTIVPIVNKVTAFTKG
jgi:hypothetical protein